MPVRAVCPECGATTIIDEDISKKAVACAQCGKQVPVPAAKSAGPPPVPQKQAPADDGGFEVLDEEAQPEPVRTEAAPQADEEEVDDRPPVGPRSRRTEDDDDEDDDRLSERSRRYADDDEDDDDDRPRGRGRRDDDKDDDDDDEDDRPRARSRDDDEDEDEDRPRARSRDDDDEDDEDDRPRATSRRDDDDEDDDDDDDDRRSARSRRDDEDEDEDDDEDRPRMRSRQDNDDDDDEEEEDDEPRARSRQDEDDEDEDERRRARARHDEDDVDDEEDEVEDEDDEDDLPVRYSGADDDDDEDEDSIPRRRPGDRDEVEQRSGKKGLILIGLLMLLLVGAAGGAAVYFLTQDDKKVVKNDGDKPPPDDQPLVDPKVPDPKVPDPKVPDPKLVDVPGLAIRPVDFAGDRKSIQLPGKPADIRAGGDGRFLFLHCPDDKKLLVYDSSEASLVREFPTAGKDAAFAAGAGKLILADNTNRTLQRYDLMSLEKDKEGPFPFEGRIDDLALGAGSNGPALVVTTPPGAWPVEFLDVDTLGKADVGWKAAPTTDLPRVASFSAAANGSRWAGIPAGPNALGAVVVTREGKQISADWVASDKSLGFVTLSADGQSMCSRLGTTNMSASVARVPTSDVASFVTPAVTGNLFVHVLPGMKETGNPGLQIALSTSANNPSPKGPTTMVPQPYAPGDKMTPDRHLHFVPEAKALVICPSGPENKLEVIKFDPVAGIPPSAIVVTSTPSDTFRPGSRFTYKVRSLASIPERNYTLSGPSGAACQPNGVVTWNVPADEKQETVRFRLTVRAPGRAAFDQTFTVYNTAAPAPKTEAPKRDPKIDSKSPDPKTPTVGTPSSIAPGVKLVQESSGRLPISAPEMKDPHVEVELPGPIRDACVAGGGRYLIFHCASKRKIAVFDVNTLKIEKQITLNSDDVLFAASMEKLLVIYPDEKVVIRYSLATFKLETDLNLEVRQRPNAAAMGSATAGPLILGGVPAQNNASNMVLTFLDLDTMKEVAIDKAEGDFKVKFGAAANLRVSADGRTLGAWYINLRPSGLQIARLAGNTIGGSYVGETVGHVTPGPDGQTIFTEKGMYTLKGEPTGRREAAVPAVHGNWFVTLAPNAKGPEGAHRVSVWEAGKTAPLVERDDLPGFDGKRDPFERDNPTLALDRRLFLVSEAKILVVVPPAANKLHVYRVDAGKK